MGKIKDKISAKVPDKLRRSKPLPGRVTNDNVADHRQQILTSGQKFKYPLQYAKHKILIGTVVVAVIALVAFSVWLWAMLYQRQTTGDYFYIVTKVLPLPVANVDGDNVPYSDYLRRLRADIFYQEQQEGVNFDVADEQRALNYLRRSELDNAIRATYAAKIARAEGLTVSDEEVDNRINETLKNSSVESESDYERITLKPFYGWTINDYRAELRNQLLERKVAFAIDQTAKQQIEQVKQRLDSGEDFASVAREVSDDLATREGGGQFSARTGDVDSDGIIAAARSLADGAVSGIIQGADSYYIVKLTTKSDDTTNFSLIKIKLKQFDADFAELQKQGKIKEFIKVPTLDEVVESQ